MKTHAIQILLCSLVCVVPITGHAESELENTALARMLQVLHSLHPLINQAEREQNPNSRLQFHYDTLQSDIAKIEAGINAKLQVSPFEPRHVEPIQGDYVSLRGQHA